jgi:hypothetical protein
MPTQLLNISDIIHLRWFKVGGITFIQIGQIQLSFCFVRRNPWRRREAQRLQAIAYGCANG